MSGQSLSSLLKNRAAVILKRHGSARLLRFKCKCCIPFLHDNLATEPSLCKGQMNFILWDCTARRGGHPGYLRKVKVSPWDEQQLPTPEIQDKCKTLTQDLLSSQYLVSSAPSAVTVMAELYVERISVNNPDVSSNTCHQSTISASCQHRADWC